MLLNPAAEKFVVHWGEMGSRWGINRTVAQVHALLYISPKPLHAEEIATTLKVARSNVSTSLRELQAWGIVKVAHVLGDRRDHFETYTDVWELFQRIMDERKKREMDPTVALLRECLTPESPNSRTRGGQPDTLDDFTRHRLTELLAFFESMNAWYDQVRLIPTGALSAFFRMGHKLRKLLTPGSKPAGKTPTHGARP
ncbi:MAG: MarR family transcriptional regulator [Phycisphaera sp.]|nr:MarR family transcriptional regulator [Phycisphaera sp.]